MDELLRKAYITMVAALDAFNYMHNTSFTLQDVSNREIQ